MQQSSGPPRVEGTAPGAMVLDPPGSPQARRLLLVGLLALLWTGLVWDVPGFAWLALPTACALPAVLVYSIVETSRLGARGDAPAPLWTLAGGVTFAGGGSLFDLVATVGINPSLSEEGNRIVRALLATDYSPAWVRGYLIVAQGLATLLVCLLWTALLRHRRTLATGLGKADPGVSFIGAALGIRRPSAHWWSISLEKSRRPRAYHMLWLAVVVVLGASGARWYLGLEWLWDDPPSDAVRLRVQAVVMTLTVAVYFTWLWTAHQEALHRQQASAVTR